VARLHTPRVKGVIVVGKRAKAVNARDADNPARALLCEHNIT
jgi:hypothetical protein